ncbi:MAG TPA: alanine racemase [Planctomycetota bacterium]|nr:alanine racemase [Planctomycetota bacterium]
MDYHIKETKWVEIDLDALEFNIKQIQRKIGNNVKIAAVVKADAYGHGAREIAGTLLETGAFQLAVSSINEALELRPLYANIDILILGNITEDYISQAIQCNLQQTVTLHIQALQISKIAEILKKTAYIHIKIDTGMSRLGFPVSEQTIKEIIHISKLPYVKIVGIFSHFATADDENKSFTHLQFDRFQWVIQQLEQNRVNIPFRHIANSAAILEFPETYLNMVRPGIILYGIYPDPSVHHKNFNLRPVMTFKAKIIHIKKLDKDCGVSYGQKYIAKKGTTIATIPVGYADGYSRLLSGKTQMLYRNRIVPVIGTICMDQCMIDITGIPDPHLGDEVVLFGTQGNHEITVDHLASLYGTISYEITSGISRRVPRIYWKHNEIVRFVSYLNS